jgi:hypothetical protein
LPELRGTFCLHLQGRLCDYSLATETFTDRLKWSPVNPRGTACTLKYIFFVCVWKIIHSFIHNVIIYVSIFIVAYFVLGIYSITAPYLCVVYECDVLYSDLCHIFLPRTLKCISLTGIWLAGKKSVSW